MRSNKKKYEARNEPCTTEPTAYYANPFEPFNLAVIHILPIARFHLQQPWAQYVATGQTLHKLQERKLKRWKKKLERPCMFEPY